MSEAWAGTLVDLYEGPEFRVGKIKPISLFREIACENERYCLELEYCKLVPNYSSTTSSFPQHLGFMRLRT